MADKLDQDDLKVLKYCGYKMEEGLLCLHLKDTPPHVCPLGPAYNSICEERIELTPLPDGNYNAVLKSLDPTSSDVCLMGVGVKDIPLFTVACANVCAMDGEFTVLYVNGDDVAVNNPYADMTYGDWQGQILDGRVILDKPTDPQYLAAAEKYFDHYLRGEPVIEPEYDRGWDTTPTSPSSGE
ncbi:hypothetical protein [Acetobacter pasteurianus]|uniref:Uncharacterized protein n=1 Tax=Acetobacter pasteurianus NBRC 3188 TaxID=1226663 RepID=A0A401WXM8_ACEPA|nr:hypothetical protein [Acetobacter pasteurianus]GCD54044.1 hypothetical protein NBRC3188_2741 [Acetobacter pasteurianus NBRC 3188]